MAQQAYEIIFLGDFRNPLFQTTTSDQIRAIVAAGYRVGILQLASNQSCLPARIHKNIRELVDLRHLAYLDPDRSVRTKLVIVIDLSCLTQKPRRILKIDSQHCVVLMPHGPLAMSGQELYDWATIQQNANEVLSGQLIWAPTTSAVREQVAHLAPRPPLSDADWHTCIAPEKWEMDRVDFYSSRPVIGRSGPAVERAWPIDVAQILSLYPDDPQLLVRILNGGSILGKRIGAVPRNWEIPTSEQLSERDFLSSIDFFVHSYHPDSISPVDTSLLKAMASGSVAIMPPQFEKIFGDGAVYAYEHEVSSTVWRLYNNRSRYLDVRQAGIQTIRSKFSFQHFAGLVSDLIGEPDRTTVRPIEGQVQQTVEAQHDKRRVMFITINGVGMGHLTRMLAIAKRCPTSIEPVFVTMSQALKVLREQGYLAEFIPSRQYLDCDLNQWNRFLRDELNEMIAFYDPAAVVFDGNVPYQGLVDSIKANPDPWFIWSRRGMWRSDNEDIVSREKHFNIVLEPGDLADSDDHGITKRYQGRTHHVQPIRLLDTSEMLSRDDARLELGLDLQKPAVLIQLGAGNNYDYRSIHKTALAHIIKGYDAQIAVGEWLISDQPIDLPDNIVRMPGYPFARYFNAFDIAISAVGYNSFHELLFSGIPTILVPNENMQQDSQIARALYADRNGLAVCVRTNEIYRLTAAIDRLFQPDERDLIRSRLAELDPTNGAAEAAALVSELAYSRRVVTPS